MGRPNAKTSQRRPKQRHNRLRPAAPPSSFIGSSSPRTASNQYADTKSSERWARRKLNSTNLDRLRPRPKEWDQAWAKTQLVQITQSDSNTFPLLRSKQYNSAPRSLQQFLPKPPPLPASTFNGCHPGLLQNKKRWMPAGKRRVKDSTKPATKKRQRRGGSERTESSQTANDSLQIDIDDLESTPGMIVESHIDAGEKSSSPPQYRIKIGPPLPLHVAITESASGQVKAMERVKNKLRTIFVDIRKATTKVKQLRENLGTKKNPTQMTTEMRIALAKLQSKLEKNTKSYNTVLNKNEAIKKQIDTERLLLQHTKRILVENSKRLTFLRKDMKKMLSNQQLVSNEELQHTIDQLIENEDKNHYHDEKIIMQHYFKLEKVKKRAKLRGPLPTMNASPRSSIQDYQMTATVDLYAKEGGRGEEEGKEVEQGEKNETKIDGTAMEEDEFYTQRLNNEEHQKQEKLLKEKETKIRQNLSPIDLQTMGAFARYAHEKETGAFTMKDKREVLSKTARMNWKIAFRLYTQRKNEEKEHMYQLSWSKILRDNPHLGTIREFVTDFLTFERRRTHLQEQVEIQNNKLNEINMDNAIMTKKLKTNTKKEETIKLKNTTQLNAWKHEISSSKDTIKKYSSNRIHIHELLKAMKPNVDRLMVLLQQYDEPGCQRIIRMNQMQGGSGHDSLIHRTIGFIENSVDAMLLVQRKQKQDERDWKASDYGGTRRGGRRFSNVRIHHTGAPNSRIAVEELDGSGNVKTMGEKRKRGSVTSKDWKIDHLLPTSFMYDQHGHAHHQHQHANTDQHTGNSVSPATPATSPKIGNGAVQTSHLNILYKSFHDSNDEHATTLIEHAPKIKYSDLVQDQHLTSDLMHQFHEKHLNKLHDKISHQHQGGWHKTQSSGWYKEHSLDSKDSRPETKLPVYM